MLMSGAITLWSRFLSPVAIKTSKHSTYLNVNQSWEMWKDAAKHFKFLDVLKPGRRLKLLRDAILRDGAGYRGLLVHAVAALLPGSEVDGVRGKEGEARLIQYTYMSRRLIIVLRARTSSSDIGGLAPIGSTLTSANTALSGKSPPLLLCRRECPSVGHPQPSSRPVVPVLRRSPRHRPVPRVTFKSYSFFQVHPLRLLPSIFLLQHVLLL